MLALVVVSVLNRKMKIALVSPVRLSTPPKKYGGSELIVALIADGLVKLGHDVTLLASGDSHTNAKLVAITERATRAETQLIDPELELSLDFEAASRAADYLSSHDFDIVHNHMDWFLLPFVNRFSAPVLTTLHRNYLHASKKAEMLSHYKELPFISISDDQRITAPKLNYIATIRHGIDTSHYEFGEIANDYLVFLGRITPIKDPVTAIKIAKTTGHKLKIAAKIDSSDLDYYENEVKPLIDGEQVQFIGEVDHKQKVELLSHARGLLSPITWQEPFGLVNIESLACGTPVIASRMGALTEIITEEVGFLCDSFEEMCQAVLDIERIDRHACRARAEDFFDSSLMTTKYIEAYRSVILAKASYI